jgi:Zn-dependent protease
MYPLARAKMSAVSKALVVAGNVTLSVPWLVLSALAPGGGYQSSWGTLLLALGGMNRDAVPGMSINGHQVSV